jgi:hypothetical protein
MEDSAVIPTPAHPHQKLGDQAMVNFSVSDFWYVKLWSTQFGIGASEVSWGKFLLGFIGYCGSRIASFAPDWYFEEIANYRLKTIFRQRADNNMILRLLLRTDRSLDIVRGFAYISLVSSEIWFDPLNMRRIDHISCEGAHTLRYSNDLQNFVITVVSKKPGSKPTLKSLKLKCDTRGLHSIPEISYGPSGIFTLMKSAQVRECYCLKELESNDDVDNGSFLDSP